MTDAQIHADEAENSSRAEFIAWWTMNAMQPPAANSDRKYRTREVEWPRLTYAAVGYFLGIGTVAALAFHDWVVTTVCLFLASAFWLWTAALDAPLID